MKISTLGPPVWFTHYVHFDFFIILWCTYAQVSTLNTKVPRNYVPTRLMLKSYVYFGSLPIYYFNKTLLFTGYHISDSFMIVWYSTLA
jgi:hypothetical protein